MKTSITIILIIIICFSGQSFSQEKKRFGIKFGVTIPSPSLYYGLSQTEFAVDGIAGLNAGVSLDIFISNKFYLTSELYTSRKEGKSKILSRDVEIGVQYLVYGLNARYDVAGKKTIAFLFAGPRIDIYLSNKINTQLAAINDIESKFSEKCKRIGAGISAGLGVEAGISQDISLQLELQYSPSFYEIYKDEFYTLESNSFEIRTGVKF